MPLKQSTWPWCFTTDFVEGKSSEAMFNFLVKRGRNSSRFPSTLPFRTAIPSSATMPRWGLSEPADLRSLPSQTHSLHCSLCRDVIAALAFRRRLWAVAFRFFQCKMKRTLSAAGSGQKGLLSWSARSSLPSYWVVTWIDGFLLWRKHSA